MSDITRDDLRIIRGDQVIQYRSITDEEFARLVLEAGFVKMNHDIATLMMDWLHNNPVKALRALLTDECDECDPNRPGYVWTAVDQDWEQCDRCGGRGWLLKDKVGNAVGDEGLDITWFPSDWLEAEDE